MTREAHREHALLACFLLAGLVLGYSLGYAQARAIPSAYTVRRQIRALLTGIGWAA